MIIPLLGGFNQVANSEGKNPKKTRGTLDLCKLLSRCEFAQAQSSYCNDKIANHPVARVLVAG